MTKKSRGAALTLGAVLTVFMLLICVCIGSVSIPLKTTLTVIWRGIFGLEIPAGMYKSIILSVRLPRVLCVALSGAALSLCGAAMQGLLRNPLADGSTMGVSTGAALGAVLALAFGESLPLNTTAMAIVFAFFSLLLILLLAYTLDKSLSTGTIILIGVVFSMFASSLINLVITFAGEKVKSITFWSMGSLAGSTYKDALLLLAALILCAIPLLNMSNELNAFAIGEDNARQIGINIRAVKLTVLITVSILIGVCVSVGGTIGFVGLIIPHITRAVTGPNHKRLLPASLLSGACFLMLADLLSRTLLSPLELPIGVITSLIGSVVFVVIFFKKRRRG